MPSLTRAEAITRAELLRVSAYHVDLDLSAARDSGQFGSTTAVRFSCADPGAATFADPEDGEVYLYAKAGMDKAPDIFACFDQPDLKATIRLAVTAPDGWTVLANGAGTQVGSGRWASAETPLVSTYLMTVVAGPYHGRSAVHDGVPLGLYCRRSLLARDGVDPALRRAVVDGTDELRRALAAREIS